MSSSVSVKKWESKSLLRAHLQDAGTRTLLLGLSAEAPRGFYSFSIMSAVGTTAVGVISSGLGVDPVVILLDGGRRGLVGHDTCLTWIDLEALAVVASRRLSGVFYDFLSVDRDDEVVVLHELGALRVDAVGAVRWSVDTDVVGESYTDEDGNLVLRLMEQGLPVVVSLESGRVAG